MSEINWNNITEIETPEEAFTKFFEVLDTVFKIACPVTNFEVNNRKKFGIMKPKKKYEK